MQFTYSIPDDQINFLKVLTSKAIQSITVLCNNADLTGSNGVRFFSDNDRVFSEDDPIMKYFTVHNGCQVRPKIIIVRTIPLSGLQIYAIDSVKSLLVC